MKSVGVSFILVLFFLTTNAEAQTNDVFQCPIISLIHPSKPAIPGETIIFSAKLENYNSEKLTFNWTTTGGDIVEGQGTPVIKVLATPELSGQFIDVTVKVKGLPEKCKDTVSERAEIAYSNADPIALDEYKNISLRDLKIRLSAVAAALRKDKKDTAYFIT